MLLCILAPPSTSQISLAFIEEHSSALFLTIWLKHHLQELDTRLVLTGSQNPHVPKATQFLLPSVGVRP